MRLWALLGGGARRRLRRVIALIGLSGLANTALIALINAATEQARMGAVNEPGGGSGVDPRLAALFLICLFAHDRFNRLAILGTNSLLQDRLAALRRRLLDKIRWAPLRALERIGQGELTSVLGHETNQLSQSLPIIVGGIQNLMLLAFMLVYMATLSQEAFLGVGAVAAIGLGLFLRERAALERAMEALHDRETAVLDGMAGFVDGFDEIRLSADKSDALFTHQGRLSAALEVAKVQAGRHEAGLSQISNVLIYALLGAAVFLLPLVIPDLSETIHKVVTVAVFCMGPVTALTVASQLFTKAEVGLENVARLERRLDRVTGQRREVVDRSRFAGFREIALEDMVFHYRDDQDDVPFTSGPWSLRLAPGEILFLTGGNGGGKSTAVKVLCGLYRPDSGRITVDGEAVTDDSRQDYRELFGAIFPDFHLLDRLHGLDETAADPERVRALIARMGLADKVTFEGGGFSTLALSTGQRKRLAMVVTLLEDRPILIFDEWAADQDSEFRQVFYEELLPDLKARGKTIIAVTHDDRYWSHCDRRLHMELGRFTTPPARLFPGDTDGIGET